MVQSTVLTISVSSPGPPGPLPPFYNLRGPSYPTAGLSLTLDGAGSPSPAWSYPQFRNLGWNCVRGDGPTWGGKANNPSFTSTLADVYNAANAAGIWVIWGLYDDFWPEQPLDVQAAVPQANWLTYFWQNSPYPGTNPALQGLGTWQAIVKDLIIPVISILDPQPCTLGYKFINEPAPGALSNLENFYAVVGAGARTVTNKRLVYEGVGALPGYANLINTIPISNYKPAIYDVHYPIERETSAQMLAEAAQTVSLGVDFWDGEEDQMPFTVAADLQLLRQANCSGDFFKWMKDGGLLVADGTGWGDAGTLTPLSTQIANACNQYLGPAVFFV